MIEWAGRTTRDVELEGPAEGGLGVGQPCPPWGRADLQAEQAEALHAVTQQWWEWQAASSAAATQREQREQLQVWRLVPLGVGSQHCLASEDAGRLDVAVSFRP